MGGGGKSGAIQQQHFNVHRNFVSNCQMIFANFVFLQLIRLLFGTDIFRYGFNEHILLIFPQSWKWKKSPFGDKKLHPGKLTWNPKHADLGSDDFPFQFGDF